MALAACDQTETAVAPPQDTPLSAQDIGSMVMATMSRSVRVSGGLVEIEDQSGVAVVPVSAVSASCGRFGISLRYGPAEGDEIDLLGDSKLLPRLPPQDELTPICRKVMAAITKIAREAPRFSHGEESASYSAFSLAR